MRDTMQLDQLLDEAIRAEGDLALADTSAAEVPGSAVPFPCVPGGDIANPSNSDEFSTKSHGDIVKDDIQDIVKDDIQDIVKDDIQDIVKDDIQDIVKDDIQDIVKDDIRDIVKDDMQDIVKDDIQKIEKCAHVCDFEITTQPVMDHHPEIGLHLPYIEIDQTQQEVVESYQCEFSAEVEIETTDEVSEECVIDDHSQNDISLNCCVELYNDVSSGDVGSSIFTVAGDNTHLHNGYTTVAQETEDEVVLQVLSQATSEHLYLQEHMEQSIETFTSSWKTPRWEMSSDFVLQPSHTYDFLPGDNAVYNGSDNIHHLNFDAFGEASLNATPQDLPSGLSHVSHFENDNIASHVTSRENGKNSKSLIKRRSEEPSSLTATKKPKLIEVGKDGMQFASMDPNGSTLGLEESSEDTKVPTEVQLVYLVYPIEENDKEMPYLQELYKDLKVDQVTGCRKEVPWLHDVTTFTSLTPLDGIDQFEAPQKLLSCSPAAEQNASLIMNWDDNDFYEFLMEERDRLGFDFSTVNVPALDKVTGHTLINMTADEYDNIVPGYGKQIKRHLLEIFRKQRQKRHKNASPARLPSIHSPINMAPYTVSYDLSQASQLPLESMSGDMDFGADNPFDVETAAPYEVHYELQSMNDVTQEELAAADHAMDMVTNPIPSAYSKRFPPLHDPFIDQSGLDECKQLHADKSPKRLEQETTPVKRGPGRPRKPEHLLKKKRKKGGRLWEFIRNLLLDPNTCPSLIKWDDPNDGTFRFVQAEKVAKMWGMRKHNSDMTYDKLSRAMRYYYKGQVFEAVLGRRLVYKFGKNAKGWSPDMSDPNFSGNDSFSYE